MPRPHPSCKAFQFPRSQPKTASAGGVTRRHSQNILQRGSSTAVPPMPRPRPAKHLARQSLSIPPLAAESSFGRRNRASPLAETFSCAAHQPPCRQMRSTAPGKTPCPGKAFQFPRSQPKAASADGIALRRSRRHSPARLINRHAAKCPDRARQSALPPQSHSIPRPPASKSDFSRRSHASPLAERSPAQPVNRHAARCPDRALQSALPRQSLSIPPLAAESSFGGWNRASPLAETFSSAAHQSPCR